MSTFWIVPKSIERTKEKPVERTECVKRQCLIYIVKRLVYSGSSKSSEPLASDFLPFYTPHAKLGTILPRTEKLKQVRQSLSPTLGQPSYKHAIPNGGCTLYDTFFIIPYLFINWSTFWPTSALSTCRAEHPK
jgi:hypothetical protein